MVGLLGFPVGACNLNVIKRKIGVFVGLNDVGAHRKLIELSKTAICGDQSTRRSQKC